MEMEIRFPGGVAVEAVVGDHVVTTDQPKTEGGDGAAPSPFDLFITSIGTCVGYYALRFCQARDLATDGMRIRLASERDPDSKLIRRIRLAIEPPAGFPERYHKALVRAADHCTVKRHLLEPPEIEVALAPSVTT